ncbi:hypothetical protein EYB26_003631 [Talaromyces marneffei]|uniref:uncharacterized protein n=1 Tax=Talaromyces marneffei TaxID=37727 RepID=UPI0012A92E73|nr:uncharacterized protein EYB26_003631 [Talaromyces marneffei]QGA15964.1 hypothetical protein EYB26_003631 [Talaromyces marneffei]
MMAPLMHNDYTIAWICALPLERAAAEVMLDETHQALPKPSTDPNAYILGKLHGHHIVIACLPTGIYGTISAAMIASHLVSTFPQVQYALMVGIGGGSPNSRNDIRLGDVVVSKPVGKYSGVIQYDYGKRVQGGRFEQTGMLNFPPQVLLTHMAHLQANQMTRSADAISTIVSNVLKQNPDMKKEFTPPSQHTDYLFRSSYHHIKEEDNCTKCDKQQLVNRQLRDNRTPHVHYGLIASGNHVMKDSETRDRLAQQLGVICFEMEAAGVMNQLPTLVIRGICDYSDSHKQKEWQGYAALTAAAYANVLLSSVPARLPTSSDAHGIAPQNDQSCLQALQAVNPFVVKNRLKENKDKLLVDAIEWIFHDPHYCRWQDEDNVRLLWIRGGAGKGKTMMSIGLVEKLSQDDSSVVTYFFCQNANYELNTIEAIIKGLIWQLIQQRPELIGPLLHHWDAEHSRWKEKMTWRALWDIFSETLHQYQRPQVYVIVDALDECQNSGMTEFLKLIVRTGLDHHHVKWLLTSRPLDSADRELLTTAEQVGISLELKSDHLEAAIEIYVGRKVNELYPSRYYGLQMPQRIKSELLYRAEGTFLWVSLVCKRLENSSIGERVPPAEALLMIQDLPPGLHRFYEQMFSQIIEGHSAIVKSCLRLLRVMMLVYRPLEIAELVSVTGMSETEVSSQKIVDRCASFIKMRGGVIEFVHQSSRDFLAQPSLLSSIDQCGHGEVALNCLSFMSTELKVNQFDLLLPNSTRKMAVEEGGCSKAKKDVLNSMNYAATFWTEHLEAVKDTTIARSALDAGGKVISFLSFSFIEWLECLSLLGQLPRAIKALKTLESIVRKDSLLYMIVFDAKRFLSRHYHTISTWPIQLYSSGIVFSPQISLARAKHNVKKVPKWLKRIPYAEKTWEALIQTLDGHSGSVHAVAFSPDGKQIASATGDGTVQLWDPSTGDHLKTLKGHSVWVEGVAFSPDSKQIASASADRTIRLWDSSTGDHLRTLNGHLYWVYAVAFSPDSKQIASASGDRTVQLWDSSTGDHLKTLEGHSSSIRAVAFSPDSKLIASASADRTIRLWNSSTGDHLRTLNGHLDWVYAVAFSPDSKQIASASGDRTVQLWDSSTGDHLKTLEGHSGSIRAVAFSPDSKLIASASDDKTIRLWDPSTGDHPRMLGGHSGSVRAFFPDGGQITSTSDDGTVCQWASSDKAVHLWYPNTGVHPRTLDGHSGPVLAVAFSPDSKLIASASSDGTVRLWDPSSGGHSRTLDSHSGWVHTVTFSPDGKQIASASEDGTIRLWDPSTGDHLKTLDDHSGLVHAVVFSPDGKQIASASADKTIRLWHPSTGVHLRTLDGHSGSVLAVAFSPNSKLIASASEDGTVRLWDLSTGDHLKTLDGHLGSVSAVAFSPDSKLIASASEDGTVRLWDPSTGDHLKTLDGHSGLVHASVDAVVFSPDGKQIASASSDRTIRLWDVRASLQSVRLLGTSLAALRKFRKWDLRIRMAAPTKRLKFSPNGQFLLTDLGLIKIGNSDTNCGLYLENGWILYRSTQVCRIVPGLLPSCYDAQGDYITIGCKNGRVLCLEFDCKILDQTM